MVGGRRSLGGDGPQSAISRRSRASATKVSTSEPPDPHSFVDVASGRVARQGRKPGRVRHTVAMPPAVATTSRDVVSVSGPDAATYLQGQLSQDVAGLAEGETAWAFVLAPQGKVEGWGRVTRVDADRYSILVDDGAGEAWAARLRRFLLRTKAEISVERSVPVVALRGPGSAEVARGLDGDLAIGWNEAGWPRIDGVDRVSTADHAALVAALVESGAAPIDEAALEAQRIRAGVGRWGAEIDHETIPATLGQWAIDASVSFSKGCYTGQELVARIDSRGGNVPRTLHGLVIDGAVPGVGAAVETVPASGADDRRSVGEVTSSAADPDGAVALTFVPRSVDVPSEGLPVEVGGHPATVVPLPF